MATLNAKQWDNNLRLSIRRNHMFKTLYRCARTVARHESGPAAQSRLEYLAHLSAGGATLHSLRANAKDLWSGFVVRRDWNFAKSRKRPPFFRSSIEARTRKKIVTDRRQREPILTRSRLSFL
jgi:hypothetical protein